MHVSSKPSIPAIEKLLNEGHCLLGELREQRRKTGERFNLFSVLRLDRSERYHSRFISYLLDPHERHDQGCAFLNSFLKWIGIDPVGEREAKSVRSVPEYPCGTGNIDIVITLPTRLIAIENKIGTRESPGQIEKYERGLKKVAPDKKRTLIFLTPSGQEPRSGRVDKCISYEDLAEWLRGALQVVEKSANPVRSGVMDYIALCEAIAQGDLHVGENEKMHELFIRDDNLLVAIEIAAQLVSFKSQTETKFVSNVIKHLETLLAQTEWSSKWLVVPSEGDVSIRTRTHSERPSYECYVQYLFTKEGCFGWSRPEWQAPPWTETEALSREMAKQSDGYEATEWWIGRNPLPEYYLSVENELILKIYEDNTSSDKLLANGLAEKVWKVFTDFISEIEALPPSQIGVDALQPRAHR